MSKRSVLTLASFTLIVMIALVVASGYLSYRHARDIANGFVKPVDENFGLDDTRLTFEHVPESDILRLAFEFKYSNPSAWDADFMIYISPFGKVLTTNPRHLFDLIDEMKDGKSPILDNLKKISNLGNARNTKNP